MVVMKSKIFEALGVRVDPTTHRQWFLSPLCPLMTHSGHERLKIGAVQTDPQPHFGGGKRLV
jgi:hypothetical protein